MSRRHFHFAIELSDDGLPHAVLSEVVTSILRHAGLSVADSEKATVEVLDAAARGTAAPCRVQFDGGVDEVEIVVTHGDAATWRGVRAVE